MSTNDQMVALIDDIYALIRDPAGLQDLVGRISDWRGADMALLTAPALSGCAPVPLIAHKMDFSPVLARPEMLMRPEFAHRAIATGGAPGVFKFEDLMPPHEQEVNEYWQAIIAPLGIASGILTMVRTPDDNMRPVSLNLYRRCSSNPFCADDVKSMQALLPHLRRALGVLLDAPLGVSSFEKDSLYAAIDTAAFFLDQAGNVAHCNDAAERLLRLEDGLMLEEGRLTLTDSELQRDLDAALGRVIGCSWSTKLRKALSYWRRGRAGRPRCCSWLFRWEPTIRSQPAPLQSDASYSPTEKPRRWTCRCQIACNVSTDLRKLKPKLPWASRWECR